ncbi:MAG TPA: serine/threonine protein phosphatase [Hellea balneolensis]|uniref:Serine/threonine protein phosphatase n=1 Tax=Hellea balneolensis TaxID=287478 RepID=A0A7C5LV66_9PROT|nr:serine/threonine protein phosphatase [Hellea balneolensis]
MPHSVHDIVYYAIGDIHGEADMLKRLHNRILRRHAVEYHGKIAIFVFLGDYVDRGPESYDVVKTLSDMQAENPATIICLKGNHEQLMLNAYADLNGQPYRMWIENGGQNTVVSYRRAGFEQPPPSHLEWMAGLPSYHWDRRANLLFVHAGIDPDYFPNDGEDRHLWTRSPRFFDTSAWTNPVLDELTVVHGHTPTANYRPQIDGVFKRINIDTGACYGGELTAAVFAHGEAPKFLSVC